MMTARTRVQLIAFVIVALVSTTYLSAKYVGIDPFSDDYRVQVTLPEAGGAFENGEVTYRGVPVGRVESLTATDDGVQAVLTIDADAPPIPADARAAVVNRSPIGEQYVDLRGTSYAEATLEDGDQVALASQPLPQDLDVLLRTARDFTESVPSDDLNTVINEGYDLSQGASLDIRRLVDTSLDFNKAADRNFLVTTSLIDSAGTVLATQKESSDSIRAYSRDLKLFAQTLADSDADLRTLIETSPVAAKEVQRLFDQVGAPLGVLMSNLVTTAQVFGTNAAGVEDALIRVPGAVSVGYAVTGSQGASIGLVPTFFDPLPCVQGYSGTQLRDGLSTGEGRPLNLKAGCTAKPSSGTNVRGPESLDGSAAPKAPAKVTVPSTLADLLGGTDD